jgi:predicted transcriptional regulator
MDQLWEADQPLLIREILERVNAARPDRPIAYTSMQTVCDRLAAKGVLLRTPAGRAFRYQPTHSREEYVAQLMVEALAEAGDRRTAFARFVDLVDGRDARQLRKLLEVRRERRGRRG